MRDEFLRNHYHFLFRLHITAGGPRQKSSNLCYYSKVACIFLPLVDCGWSQRQVHHSRLVIIGREVRGWRELNAIGAVLSSSIYLGQSGSMYSKRKDGRGATVDPLFFFFFPKKCMSHTELMVEMFVGEWLVVCVETERFCADQLKKC